MTSERKLTPEEGYALFKIRRRKRLTMNSAVLIFGIVMLLVDYSDNWLAWAVITLAAVAMLVEIVAELLWRSNISKSASRQ